MLNTVRMDLKRTLNSRSFYLILIINFSVLILLSCFFSFLLSDRFQEMTIGNSNINVSTQADRQAQLTEEQVDILKSTTKDEMSVGYLMYAMNNVAIYSLLIFMTLFVVSELDTGYIKNIPLSSKRRSQLVISKILVAFIVSVAQVISLFFSAILGNLISVGQVNFGNFYDFAIYWGPYCLISTALSALIILCAYLTKSKVFTIIFATIISGGIFDLFLRMFANAMNLSSEYFVKYTLKYFYQQESFKPEILRLTLPLALGFGLVYTGLAVCRLRRMEIR
ncbi:MAG: hypothetical protein Q4P08_04965 [Eubacteriales bacterium]|nr:hypothetical protein [Eubacteriales bacterium]